MAKSIAEEVQDYLKENPEAGNKELYEAFPKVRQNTLRHYRSKFAPTPAKAKKVKKEVAPKAKRGRPRKTTGDLESRVGNLEKQMDQLLKTLDVQVGKRGRRVNPIDKRFRELEETLMKFLKQKTASMPSDLAKLDDLQKALTAKIHGFIDNLKKR
ncbi:MAG: hypothetical protein RRB13_07875 [bacterium]|nr:hypothetical protein [bacterium]